MDFSFLKLYSTINGYLNDNKFKNTHISYYLSIQLSPNEVYLQMTNFDGGISIDSDFKAYLVDSCDNALTEITENIFIEEFIDSNGNNQCKIEIVNLGVDYYGRAVQIRIDQISSNAKYYTRPIKVTNKDIDKTYRFDYKNSKNLYGLSYENADCYQSIRLCNEFSGLNNKTEVNDYYQISTENNISFRPLRQIANNYIIENIDTFTSERLQELLLHNIVYIDGKRITNKPILEIGDRRGKTNIFTANFTANVSTTDTYEQSYQIFNGLQITSILPSTLATPCTIETDATVTFNIPITLNTGTVTIYDASDNSVVRTFTEADMSVVVPNQLYIADFLVPQLLNGNYYVHISQGLVSGLGIDFEGISDTTTWTFSLTDGQFNRLEFNNTEFLVDCPSEPDPINDNLVLFYKFNETSGTVATDSSSFFNNGTINGAEINQTGLVDKCYRFNNVSTDQYVEVLDAPSLNFGNGAFGIEVWINASANFGQILNKYNISTGNLQYRLFIQSGVLQFFIYTDASNRIGIADNVTITTGAWQQIFITYDGSGLASGLKMWVDNVPASFSPIMTGTYTGMTPTSQSLILAQQADDLAGANRYSGLMDILRIWKGYAPTEAEKTTLYNSGNGTES